VGFRRRRRLGRRQQRIPRRASSPPATHREVTPRATIHGEVSTTRSDDLRESRRKAGRLYSPSPQELTLARAYVGEAAVIWIVRTTPTPIAATIGPEPSGSEVVATNYLRNMTRDEWRLMGAGAAFGVFVGSLFFGWMDWEGSSPFRRRSRSCSSAAEGRDRPIRDHGCRGRSGHRGDCRTRVRTRHSGGSTSST
jgi:hypothetical protein